jgi:hypothetical protein
MLNRVCVTVCSLLFLSSCQFENSENNARIQTLLEADALFISNEENLKIENDYYDAILEIKKIYPGEMNDVILLKHNDYPYIGNQFNVTTYPTLLLIDKKQVITKIDGENEREFIIDKISSYIEDTQNTQKN